MHEVESMESMDLNDHFETKRKQRVVGFNLPPNDSISLDGISDDEGDDDSWEDDEDDFQTNSDYDSECENLPGSENGNSRTYGDGDGSQVVRDLESEQDTAASLRIPFSPSDDWPLSSNPQQIDESNLMSRIEKLNSNRNLNNGGAAFLEDINGDTNLIYEMNPEGGVDNSDQENTQKPLVKRPFLKKGSGLARFYREVPQKLTGTNPNLKSNSISVSVKKIPPASAKKISPISAKGISSGSTKLIPPVSTKTIHSASAKSIPPVLVKKISSASVKTIPTISEKNMPPVSVKTMTSVSSKTIPPLNTMRSISKNPTKFCQGPQDYKFKDDSSRYPVQKTDDYAQLIGKASVKFSDKISFLPDTFSNQNVAHTKYEDCFPQSMLKSVTETASLSSFSDSDCESEQEDPEIHLFELMETVSANPKFSESSELVQKFVSGEPVNKNISDELRRLNNALIEDKNDLQIRNENLMKEKILLLRAIEDLLKQKEVLLKENKMIQRKGELDLRLEKECWEPEIQSWLKEKEMLKKRKNDLLIEKKRLVSENISLLKENERLSEEKLYLLNEKEAWTKEKNEILAAKQEWENKNNLEKKKLVKAKQKLLAEKNSLTDRKSQTPEALNVKETRLPNGDIEITLDNGTTKYINKDGQDFKYVYQNGDIKELKMDGSIEYFYGESKIWHITQPDGIVIMKFPNGQVETVQPDGLKTVVYSNNIIRKIHPNGTEEYIYPDNTIVLKDSDGTKCFTFPNGQKEYHYEHFIKRIYPDGTVKTLFKNGSSETRWASGRVRAKDSEGNLTYDTAQPSPKEFLRDISNYV